MRDHRVWLQKASILLVGLLVGSLSIMGCLSDCGSSGSSTSNSSEDVQKVTATPEQVNARILGGPTPVSGYNPDDFLMVKLYAGWPDHDADGTMTWTPPAGATDFDFPDSMQPEPGGPPFVFKNVNWVTANQGLEVMYRVPPAASVGAENKFYDMLTVNQTANGNKIIQNSILYHKLASGLRASPVGGSIHITLPAADPVLKWRVQNGVTIESALTPAACQSLVAGLQSGNTFTALRLPLADAIADETAYALPVVFSGDAAPLMLLISGPVFAELPLEVRTDATVWANDNLPFAPGELWAALGVRQDADLSNVCLFASGTSPITLVTDLQLDLSSRPAACEGCQVASYFCYESAPAMVQAVEIDGYNCLGSGETTLTPMGDWLFEDYTFAQTRKPGDAAALHYWVFNNDTAAHTFTINSTSSTLNGAGWAIHPGLNADPWTPDTSQTISGPFNVLAGGEFHIHILGTVPAGTASGDYDYRMTINGSGVTPPQRSGSSLIFISPDGSLPPMPEPEPEVALAGSANLDFIAAGETLAYTFTVRNNGDEPLTSLLVTDALPANTTYVSCAGADVCTESGGTVTWNLAGLGVNQQRSVTLTVQVNPGLADGTIINNSGASVTTAQQVSDESGPVLVTVGTVFKVFIPVLRK